MTNIINLTPHAICVVDADSKPLFTINPSGTVARVEMEKTMIGNVNGVPINQNNLGNVFGIPDPQPNTIFIVSLITAQNLKGVRDDLLVVDETIRDENNRIIGCKSFAKL
jgi:hypothetical protein